MPRYRLALPPSLALFVARLRAHSKSDLGCPLFLLLKDVCFRMIFGVLAGQTYFLFLPPYLEARMAINFFSSIVLIFF